MAEELIVDLLRIGRAAGTLPICKHTDCLRCRTSGEGKKRKVNNTAFYREDSPLREKAYATSQCSQPSRRPGILGRRPRQRRRKESGPSPFWPRFARKPGVALVCHKGNSVAGTCANPADRLQGPDAGAD
jgi:hypothetical protein